MDVYRCVWMCIDVYGCVYGCVYDVLRRCAVLSGVSCGRARCSSNLFLTVYKSFHRSPTAPLYKPVREAAQDMDAGTIAVWSREPFALPDLTTYYTLSVLL